MLVGHYAPALALEAAFPRVPLWILFIAVQLVDIAWSVLILLGIEHARVIPGTSAFDVLDLYDMPWTHSLLATAGWAGLAGALAAAVVRTDRARTAAVIAVAVASHVVLDLAVHAPDISIAGNDTAHLGLGLWRTPMLALALEAALVAAGGTLAWRSTWAAPRRRAVALLVGALVLAAVISPFVPAPPTIYGVVAAAMAPCAVATVAAFLVDRSGRA